MKETVLLYNFSDKERSGRVRLALAPLGFRLKAVDRKDYLLPVGVLAGVKGMEADKDAPSYDGPEFEEEMALLAGISSAGVDTFIKALRKTGVGKINFKAVLTETNREWDSLKLYNEIKEEHEAMSRQI